MGARSRLVLFVMLLAAQGGAHAQQGDAKRGQNVFEACRAGHAADGNSNEVGPALRGVFGRKAGTREDFRYSPALKRSGITWTPQSMNDFLADPQKAVPANRMPFDGVPNAADRADLIAYLMKASK